MSFPKSGRLLRSESVFAAVLRGGDLFALPEEGRKLADVLESQLGGDLRNGAVGRGEQHKIGRVL